MDHRYIDTHNIRNASMAAMYKAVMQLVNSTKKTPAAFLVDALPLNFSTSNHTDIPVHSFIKGEQKSISIAAASIIAKVIRDQMITDIDSLFPGYFLSKHKGYGTVKHRESLQQKNSSIIHRSTFLKNIIAQQ